MTTMLKIRNLEAFYGQAQILFGINLDVRAGEIVVLLGRNGVGKTTTLKSIMGLTPSRTGEILFKKVHILQQPPHKIAKLGLGYAPEDRRIFTRLTVMENLEVARQPARKGLRPWTPERLFKLFPNLADRHRLAGGALSGGEQQMLTIARTLMGNPEMLILDEPSEGLAPVIIDQLARTIGKLKAQGVALLLAEQNLNFARRICDRAYIIHQGKVHHESPLDALSDEIYAKYCAV